MEDIEEELKKYFQGYWPGTETVEQCNTDLHFTPPAIIRLARHFYEIGCRRTAEKFDEIEYNRQMAEERQMEKETPNDLEEAAEEYSFNIPSKLFHLLSEEQQILWKKEIEQAYLAGAKWQKEQDDKELSDLLTIAHLQGADQMKEQMMEEAVKGEITKDNRGNNALRVGVLNNGFEIGDKVRIIIVKE